MSYPDFMDYFMAVARGHEENGKTVKADLKYGRITVLSTANTTVWNRNELYNYPTAATLMKVASSSGDDAAAGTGAIKLTVEGVLGSWTEASEELSLAGTTPKTTTNLFLRINRMFVGSTGSGNENAGNITIIENNTAINTFTAGGVPTTTSSVYGQVLATEGQTQMARYSVPLSFTAYVTQVHASSGQSKSITQELFSRKPGESFRLRTTLQYFRNSPTREFKPPLKFTAQTDIELRARGSSTAGIVSGEFNMILAEGD